RTVFSPKRRSAGFPSAATIIASQRRGDGPGGQTAKRPHDLAFMAAGFSTYWDHATCEKRSKWSRRFPSARRRSQRGNGALAHVDSSLGDSIQFGETANHLDQKTHQRNSETLLRVPLVSIRTNHRPARDHRRLRAR